MKKRLAVLITALAMLAVSFSGCGSTENPGTTTDSTSSQQQDAENLQDDETADKEEASDSNEQAENAENNADDSSATSSEVTDRRDFIVTLYSEYAPITCENFEKLVSEGFYNGLTFHRVVDEFMAQGGDPMGTGMGGSENTIKGEFMANGVDNKLSHKRGVISMARSSDPDSASSQFFICYVDYPFLDGNYAAFGEVTEGMEVIDAFLAVPRSYNMSGELASPQTPIVIKEAVMMDPDENGNHRVHFTMEEFIR